MTSAFVLSRLDRRNDDAVPVPMEISLEEGDVLGRNTAAPDNRVSRRAVLCGPSCRGGIQLTNVGTGVVFHFSGRTDASTGELAFDVVPAGGSVTLKAGDVIRFLPDRFVYEVVARAPRGVAGALSPPPAPRPPKVRRQVSGEADVSRPDAHDSSAQASRTAGAHPTSQPHSGPTSSLSSLSTARRSAASKASVAGSFSTSSSNLSAAATPPRQTGGCEAVGTGGTEGGSAADTATKLCSIIGHERGSTGSHRLRDCDIYLFPRSAGLSATVLDIWQHGLRKLGARTFTAPPATSDAEADTTEPKRTRVAAQPAAGAGSGPRIVFAPGDSDSDADRKPLSQSEGTARTTPAPKLPVDSRPRVIVAGDDVSAEQLRAWWGQDAPLATNVRHLSLDAELVGHLHADPSLRQEALRRRGFAEYHAPEWVIRCIGLRKRLPPEAFPWLGRSTRRPLPAAGHAGVAAERAVSDGSAADEVATRDRTLRGDGAAGAEASTLSLADARARAVDDPYAAALRAPDAAGDVLGQRPAISPTRLLSFASGAGSGQRRPAPGFSEHGEDAEELSQRLPSPHLAGEAEVGGEAAGTAGPATDGSWWRALYRCGDDASRWGIDPEVTPPLACPFSEEDIQRANGALLRNHPWLVPDVTAGRRYVHRITAASSFAVAGSIADSRVAGGPGGSCSSTCELPHNPHGRARGVNLNEHITRHLLPLLDVYTVVRDADSEARIKQLDHAIGALTHCPFAVRTAVDAERVSGIGRKTRAKIAEILATGRLQRADALARSPRIRALLALTDVLWVGPVTANALWNAGYRSVEDLRERGQHALSHQQRLGLRYYDELRQRVSRAESEHMGRVVAAEVQRILPGSLCVLGGSFRRGQPSQSDFDFVLSPPPPFTTWDLLPALYRRLRALNIIVHDLSGSWLQLAADGSLSDVPDVGWDPARMPDAAYAYYDRAGFSVHGTSAAGSASGTTVGHGKRGSAGSAISGSLPFPGAPGAVFGSGAMDGGCHTYFGISITPAWPHAIHRRIDLKCFHHTEVSDEAGWGCPLAALHHVLDPVASHSCGNVEGSPHLPVDRLVFVVSAAAACAPPVDRKHSLEP